MTAPGGKLRLSSIPNRSASLLRRPLPIVADPAAPASCCEAPGEPPARAKSELAGLHAGCLSCGAELVYLQAAVRMVCAGCGAVHDSNARCAAGHFYCDACHAGSAVDVVERRLAASHETDPLALAVELMRHPKVKMHGPEHHYLAPAVLVAAWCNLVGQPERKPALLAEVRRRSAPVGGGFCGYQGACGAAVGTGIFASIVTGATPVTARPRAQALGITAEALRVLAGMDAPRCCKRDTFLSLLTAARYARKHLGIAFPARGVRCEFSDANRECIGERCPFHRR